jgi:hypothetical protein
MNTLGGTPVKVKAGLRSVLQNVTQKYGCIWRLSGDVASPVTSHDLAMNRDGIDQLTVNEFLRLFGLTANESRWMGSADSEEYLTLVTYLVERSAAR